VEGRTAGFWIFLHKFIKFIPNQSADARMENILNWPDQSIHSEAFTGGKGSIIFDKALFQ
jgi:hypothetical protein